TTRTMTRGCRSQRLDRRRPAARWASFQTWGVSQRARAARAVVQWGRISRLLRRGVVATLMLAGDGFFSCATAHGNPPNSGCRQRTVTEPAVGAYNDERAETVNAVAWHPSGTYFSGPRPRQPACPNSPISSSTSNASAPVSRG